MQIIIGRKHEQEILQKVLDSNESEFVALYGRRRVGKTFLIEKFFQNNCHFFQLTGIKDGKTQEQLNNFAYEFNKTFSYPIIQVPTSWNHAFQWLIQSLEKLESSRKKVVFFDECPWLASSRSGFLQALDYFWNTWGVKQRDFILIVCGSAASWMIKKIIRNKGGLHNRLTQRIRLMPFSLKETEAYLKSRSVNLNRIQILTLYMAMGGIPYYLRHVQANQSATQNINRICFSKDGALADEYHLIFNSLFDHAYWYEKLVSILAKHRYGLSRDMLLQKAKLQSGGAATDILEALEESGFITQFIPYGKQIHHRFYRLTDPYVFFYWKWIHQTPSSILNSPEHQYWIQLHQSTKWPSWAGYMFENICYSHILSIKTALGIRGVYSLDSIWRSPGVGDTPKGSQIDLVIDRSDQCMSLCEMKYSENSYVLTSAEYKKMKDRTQRFITETRTQKTLLWVLVTPVAVQKNESYLDLFHETVTLAAFFS